MLLLEVWSRHSRVTFFPFLCLNASEQTGLTCGLACSWSWPSFLLYTIFMSMSCSSFRAHLQTWKTSSTATMARYTNRPWPHRRRELEQGVLQGLNYATPGHADGEKLVSRYCRTHNRDGRQLQAARAPPTIRLGPLCMSSALITLMLHSCFHSSWASRLYPQHSNVRARYA